jgi:hypothetical protein
VQCVLTQGADIDDSPGSLIWSCCLSDGCVVCGSGWTNCKWEPAFRSGQWLQSMRPKTFGAAQGGAPAAAEPTLTQPRPRWLGTGRLAPLQ